MSETSSDYEMDSTDSETESITSENFDEVLEVEELDNIYEFDEEYHIDLPSTTVQRKYYIGCYKYIPTENILLFVNKVHSTTFFQFNYKQLSKYFFWYSGTFMPKYPAIDILQLHVLPDDTFVAVVKTYYIKIIQRTWKKIYKQRKQYISNRMCLGNFYHYAIGKKTGPSFPGLRGMLSR